MADIRTVPDHPTPESIALARAAQQRERAAFTAKTGLVLDDEGRVALLLGNAMAAAVFGLRGEHRIHRG